MKGSWKTTLTGVLTIVAAVAGAGLMALKGQFEAAIATAATGITAGIGLISARDNDKSSEDVGNK